MRKSQELTLKISEAREKLNSVIAKRNALPDGETPSTELIAEMGAATKAVAPLEVELRAAITSEAAEDDEARKADPDAETRERIELRGKVKLGNYAAAAIEMRAADGAELEYNQARGISGNRFPLELLAPVETRAATGVDTSTSPRRWLDRLFAGSASQAVGITMESVPPGIASFPVTATGATAAQRAKSQAAGDAVWTLDVTEMKPTRNATRLIFNVEDAARIPGLESALNRDLRAALVEGVDRAIFLGDAGATGTDADIVGLTTAAGLTEKTISQSAKIKGSDVLKTFAELVDGKAAMTPADLRTVFAVGANTLWSHTLANTGASVDTTVAEFLRRFGLSWLTRGEVEVATTNDKFAAFVGLNRGIEGAGVAAIWESGELVRDPYSGAAKGEVALTLSYLWSFGLPRASNFARIKFVT